MNYVKNMEAMIASVVIWVILVLVALTTTCGTILARLTEPVEILLASGLKMKDK